MGNVSVFNVGFLSGLIGVVYRQGSLQTNCLILDSSTNSGTPALGRMDLCLLILSVPEAVEACPSHSRIGGNHTCKNETCK